MINSFGLGWLGPEQVATCCYLIFTRSYSAAWLIYVSTIDIYNVNFYIFTRNLPEKFLHDSGPKNSRSFLWTISRPRMPCTMMRMPKRQKPSDISFCLLSFFVDCRLIYQIIKCFFFVCIVALDQPKSARERHEHGLQHTAAWGKRSCKRHLKEEPLLRERLSALPTVIGWLVRWVLRFVGVPLLQSGTQ